MTAIGFYFLLLIVTAFSSGVCFERDRRRWKDQQKRRELGRRILNSRNL